MRVEITGGSWDGQVYRVVRGTRYIYVYGGQPHTVPPDLPDEPAEPVEVLALPIEDGKVYWPREDQMA